MKITFVKVLLNWPQVFEILLPVSSTTACLILLTLSPFHHFPCSKYITLVFCAFSDSPTLSHSTSTLHKNIGTWTISHGQFYCHMYIYKHVFFTTLPYKRYIKKKQIPRIIAIKWPLVSVLLTSDFRFWKSVLFSFYRSITNWPEEFCCCCCCCFFLLKRNLIKLQLNLTAGDWMFPNSYKAT